MEPINGLKFRIIHIQEWRAEELINLLLVSLYPLQKDDWFYAAPIVYARGNYIIFGGWIGKIIDAKSSTEKTQSDLIARFNPDSNQWSTVGRLNAPRYGHGAIEFTEGQFLVVGGSKEHKTERCSLIDENEVKCIMQEPTLSEYKHWPELLLIEDGHCSK